MNAAPQEPSYPGAPLGLPEQGVGSMAPWGRRILALFIDWGIASLISAAWFDLHPMVTVGIFAGMHILGIGLLGTTVGKRIVRLQVVRGKKAPGIHWALVRTLLLLLVIPVIAISPDGRGGHDKIADTVELCM